jgi:prevent-host-death family protein
MDEVFSATEAKRNFARLLQGARDGRSYTVTIRGEPVARIVPLSDDERMAAARTALLARLKRQKARNVPRRWTRDDLYD